MYLIVYPESIFSVVAYTCAPIFFTSEDRNEIYSLNSTLQLEAQDNFYDALQFGESNRCKADPS